MEKTLKKEVEMNKNIFYEKLKNREYTECIDILRKEIIDIFVEKIREKENTFNYSTTRDLYNASKRYLENKEISIAYQLYNFDITNEVDEYMLDELFQSFQELTKIV